MKSQTLIHLAPKALINLTLISALSLTACAQKDEKKIVSNKVSITAQMNSEELALAGEQLVGPYSFMLADRVFDEALKQDSGNKRAQFYKALLKPFMAFKGLGANVRPAIKKYKGEAELAEYDQKLAKQAPNSALKSFLLDTKDTKTITSVTDAQDFLAKVQDGFNDFRKFLKANHDLDLTLNINPLYVNGLNIPEGEASTYCQLVEDSAADSIYGDYNCDFSNSLQKRVNAADVIVMQQIAAGMVLYFGMLNSYSLEGLDKLELMKEKAGVDELDPDTVYKVLMGTPKFGTLRKNHVFQYVKELGLDFTAGARWVIKIQRELCPNGQENERIRPGNLITSAICVEDQDTAFSQIRIIEDVLSKATEVPSEQEDGSYRKIKVNVPAFLARPITDLKTLVSRKNINACGDLVRLTDPTLNGLFPDGIPENAETECVE